jgi:hypothetical protein
MIRYPITASELNQQIEAEKSGWLEEARELTLHPYKDNGDLKSGKWSQIKAVYMRLQHSKCGYCERVFESERYGKIEHDVEHFRPKNEVTKWPTRKIERERSITYEFRTGKASSKGYLKLWHHPLNYLNSCKTCNSTLKSDYFPIEGRRNIRATNPTIQDGEKALLIYPIGDFDIDPEDVIGFYGHLAIAKAPTGTREHRRALVTIDFFELNRTTLQKQRADVITHLSMALMVRDLTDGDSRADAENDIARLCHASSNHASCARAYVGLYEDDKDKARALATEARKLLDPR